MIFGNVLGRYLAILSKEESKEFSNEEDDVFNKPFKEAINYLVNRKPILSKELEKIEEIEKQNYFWVKQAGDLEITKKIQEYFVKGLEKGKSTFDIIRDLDDENLLNGLGENSRYWKQAVEMNVALAQSRGNWEKMQEYKGNGFKFARYSAIIDGRETHVCHSLNGKVMSLDDFEKEELVPPLHFGCRSTLIQLSDEEVLDKNGNFRKHIKTINVELAKKHKQKGFGFISNTNVKDIVEEKKKKVDKLEKIIKKKSKENKNLPKTLSNFKDYSKDWEEKYINSKITTEKKEEMISKLKKIIDDNEFSMRFKEKYFSQLVKDGKFKNQFETGTSGGTINTKFRKLGSNKLFGHGKKLKPHEYEKYGYLGYKNFLDDIKKGLSLEQYGGYIIRFDKNKLLNRVTYTINDSLGPVLNNKLIASDVFKPNLNSIETDILEKIYNEIKKNKNFNLDNFSNKYFDEYRVRYFELQYHGDLTLDDVKEICFTIKEPDKEIIDKLKSKGIKLWKLIGDDLNEI